MTTYTAFNAPFFSIFDPGLYREVRYKWEGTNVFYLFGLILCILVISAVSWFIFFDKVYKDHSQRLVQQMPVMTFKNGELTIDRDSPYLVEPEFAPSIALLKFDTTQDSTSSNGEAMVLFSKKTLVMPFMSMPYPFGNTTLPPEAVGGMLRMSTFTIPVLYVLIGLPFLWTLHTMQAILYAGVAVLLAQMSATKLPFDAAMRLAIMAMTPVMLLSTALTVVQWTMGAMLPYLEHWGFITVPIVIGYLVFAIRSSSTRPPETDPAAP